MAKQTFTAGQVLTATQMNNLQANDYNWSTNAQTASYTLVAADAGKTVTMTNAGATTVTVNTGLFTAGDRVQVINLGSGTCTITAGTATVNSASSLALIQYQSGTIWFSSASAAIFIPDDKTVSSGLTLVKTQTIGSAVSSVSVTNAFSATYDNYKIIISGGVSSSAEIEMTTTLTGSTSGYYYGMVYNSYNTSAVSLGGTNAAGWLYTGGGSTNVLQFNMELQNPFLAKYTNFQASLQRVGIQGFISGYHAVATSYTGITITPASGTITGGTIYVYGYANS